MRLTKQTSPANERLVANTHALMTKQKVSRRHLAKRAGIHVNTLDGFATNNTTLGAIVSVADALGVDIAELFKSGTPPKPARNERFWTTEEDARLIWLRVKGYTFPVIARQMSGRDVNACMGRYRRLSGLR